jgi:hypothetical protein
MSFKSSFSRKAQPSPAGANDDEDDSGIESVPGYVKSITLSVEGQSEKHSKLAHAHAHDRLRQKQHEGSTAARAPLLPLPPPKPCSSPQLGGGNGVCVSCGVDRAELQWALKRIEEYDRILVHMRSFENEISMRVRATEVSCVRVSLSLAVCAPVSVHVCRVSFSTTTPRARAPCLCLLCVNVCSKSEFPAGCAAEWERVGKARLLRAYGGISAGWRRAPPGTF